MLMAREHTHTMLELVSETKKQIWGAKQSVFTLFQHLEKTERQTFIKFPKTLMEADQIT